MVAHILAHLEGVSGLVSGTIIIACGEVRPGQAYSYIRFIKPVTSGSSILQGFVQIAPSSFSVSNTTCIPSPPSQQSFDQYQPLRDAAGDINSLDITLHSLFLLPSVRKKIPQDSMTAADIIGPMNSFADPKVGLGYSAGIISFTFEP